MPKHPKKPGNVAPGFNPTRQADPGVTSDLSRMLQLLDPIQQRKGEQVAGIVRGMDKSIPRSAIPGEIRGQGLGNPASTGLAGFYRNNPNMRVAEFDPTGSKNIGRFTRDYARQDQLGAAQHGNAMMDQRNQYATGLSDLWKTRNKMTGKGWIGPAKPGAVWGPLGE